MQNGHKKYNASYKCNHTLVVSFSFFDAHMCLAPLDHNLHGLQNPIEA